MRISPLTINPLKWRVASIAWFSILNIPTNKPLGSRRELSNVTVTSAMSLRFAQGSAESPPWATLTTIRHVTNEIDRQICRNKLRPPIWVEHRDCGPLGDLRGSRDCFRRRLNVSFAHQPVNRRAALSLQRRVQLCERITQLAIQLPRRIRDHQT
jgi:hypothetical protein